MRCLQCGQEIQSKTAKKFCCSSCAATYNNQHRAYTTKGRTKLHICTKCGKQFEGSVHLTGIRRICHECGGGTWLEKKKHMKPRYTAEMRFQQWLNDDATIVCSKNGAILRTFRDKFIEHKGCKCEKCGWGKLHPVTHKSPLEIHHIDGDCFNNTKENLQLLCPNCHSLTENFGARNKNCKKKYYIMHK